MSDNDCRILAKACGLCWHEYRQDDEKDDYYRYCIHCGCSRAGVGDGRFNPTLPDNWELVRVKVIIPNLREFRDSLFLYVTSVCRDTSSLEWWWTKTPEEKCQIAADFIKARHDLFPWVTDFLREREKGEGDGAEV